MSDGAKFGGGGICCLFISILIIVLLVMSFKDIDADQQALKYNGIAKTLAGYDKDKSLEGQEVSVFDQGKHHVWPGQYMIKYYNRYSAMELSGDSAQNCISKDGVVITTDLRIMYKMIRKELHVALFEFGEQEDVEGYVMRLAHDAIRDGCSGFAAEEFYANRRQIEAAIAERFGVLVSENKAHVEPGPIQFTNAKMPLQFENSVVEKLKAKQDIESARGPERAGKILDAEIALAVANITSKVDIANATATKDAILAAAEKEVPGIVADFEQKAAAWKYYKEQNGLSVQEFISGYFSALAMENSSLPVYTSNSMGAASSVSAGAAVLPPAANIISN
jgi:regulator of protease activity HflC (stomatin/prohibitin superfamily)